MSFARGYRDDGYRSFGRPAGRPAPGDRIGDAAMISAAC